MAEPYRCGPTTQTELLSFLFGTIGALYGVLAKLEHEQKTAEPDEEPDKPDEENHATSYG
jgi:hypothetical protein